MVEISFSFEVFLSSDSPNELFAFVYFDGSIELVQNYYDVSFFVNSQTPISSLSFVKSNNTLISTLTYDQPANQDTVAIRFSNKTNL